MTTFLTVNTFVYSSLLCYNLLFSAHYILGDNMSMIGDRLKRLRKDYGYTQKQIAEYLDIDQAYISRIEKGERTLNLSLLDKICQLYNCTPDYILGKDDNYQKRSVAFRSDGNDVDLNVVAKINSVMNNLELLRKLNGE